MDSSTLESALRKKLRRNSSLSLTFTSVSVRRRTKEAALRFSQRFSELIDELTPNSWVALTPDRKVVAGIGTTQEEAALNAKSDYGLQNPILIRVSDYAGEGK